MRERERKGEREKKREKRKEEREKKKIYVLWIRIVEKKYGGCFAQESRERINEQTERKEKKTK